MNVTKTINELTTGKGKQYSKTYIAEILGYTRKTIYDKMKNDSFTAVEIATLRSKGIIK